MSGWIHSKNTIKGKISFTQSLSIISAFVSLPNKVFKPASPPDLSITSYWSICRRVKLLLNLFHIPHTPLMWIMSLIFKSHNSAGDHQGGFCYFTVSQIVWSVEIKLRSPKIPWITPKIVSKINQTRKWYNKQCFQSICGKTERRESCSSDDSARRTWRWSVLKV